MIANRILIYDPVPIKGGSKKVLQAILTELPSSNEIWVLTNDKSSWLGENVQLVSLCAPRVLLSKNSGVLFFVKHLIFLACLFFHLCRLKRFNKIIGISGPCVDFALYLLSEIITLEIIQLIQGNIANSKISAFGLQRAKQVFYLPSTHQSIQQTLTSQNIDSNAMQARLKPFINGVNGKQIKASTVQNKAVFLWAASLLKWKRVELYTEAIKQLNALPKYQNQYSANLCYIETESPFSIDINQYQSITNINYYSDPVNLNDIRASSSVFISTSEQEPFGLSILEAMTAGLAIVIPTDGAYWDQHLQDGINCIKYEAGSSQSLLQALTRLIDQPELLKRISQQAKFSAQQYSLQHCYADILNSILK